MTTTRDRAKADRRAALLAAAARLFAERGYERVSLEELGAAAGVSGPAIYRHFPGKQAVLAAILVGASEGLLEGGRAVVEREPDADAALAELVAFHLDFAIAQPDVIRVQDRDLDSLADDDRHHVRAVQRTYVDLWAGLLGRIHPDEYAGRTARPRAGRVRPHELDPAQRPPRQRRRDPPHPRADGPRRPPRRVIGCAGRSAL